jgi:tetratricopeptide (TPR) repeat protein
MLSLDEFSLFDDLLVDLFFESNFSMKHENSKNRNPLYQKFHFRCIERNCEKRKMQSEAKNSITIGQKIRVLPVDPNEESSIGIISYIHLKDPEQRPTGVDVLYDNPTREESDVVIDRIHHLLPFEEISLAELQTLDANSLKEYGNDLFRLKDYSKAMEFYQLALQSFHSRQKKSVLAIGTSILIFNHQVGDFYFGMISSNDEGEGEYEIVLSDDSETTAKESDLIEIPQQYELQLLTRSCYSNLAKCALKRNLKGWAVRYSSLSLALTRAMISLAQDTGLYDKNEEKRKQLSQFLIDSLYFRGKVFVSACRPRRAKADYQELTTLDPKKGKSLETEIQQFKIKRQKDNRKLAKEIAKWVDSSMGQMKSGAMELQRGGGGGDLPMGEDEEEDDD